MAASATFCALHSVRNTTLWFDRPRKRRSGYTPLTIRRSHSLLQSSAIVIPRYHQEGCPREGARQRPRVAPLSRAIAPNVVCAAFNPSRQRSAWERLLAGSCGCRSAMATAWWWRRRSDTEQTDAWELRRWRRSNRLPSHRRLGPDRDRSETL